MSTAFENLRQSENRFIHKNGRHKKVFMLVLQIFFNGLFVCVCVCVCVCLNGGMRKGIALEIKSPIRRERILDMWKSLQSLTSLYVLYLTTDFTLLHTQKVGKKGGIIKLSHAKKNTQPHACTHTQPLLT